MPQLPSHEAVVNSDLPNYVEIPKSYFPAGVGPGGFDPKVMYAHALAAQRGMIHEIEMRSWVLLWLLDHVDWEELK